MGYKPDWQNQSHAKNGSTTSKPGIVSRPIFHGEKQQPQPKLYLADGTEGGVDVNWMAGENYGDNTTAEQRVEMSGGDMAKFKSDQISKMPELSEPKEEGKRQSFSEAFKSAKDGSTFEWNGKQYKKEYAKAPAAKKAAPEREDGKFMDTTTTAAKRSAADRADEDKIRNAGVGGKENDAVLKRKFVQGATPSRTSLVDMEDKRTKEEKIKANKGGKFVQGRTPS
jgi:hypothetical protein